MVSLHQMSISKCHYYEWHIKCPHMFQHKLSSYYLLQESMLENLFPSPILSFHQNFIIQGLSPTDAIKILFEVAKRRILDPQFGVIVIDRNGRIGIGHLTKNLSWAVMTEKDEKVRAGIKYNLS